MEGSGTQKEQEQVETGTGKSKWGLKKGEKGKKKGTIRGARGESQGTKKRGVNRKNMKRRKRGKSRTLTVYRKLAEGGWKDGLLKRRNTTTQKLALIDNKQPEKKCCSKTCGLGGGEKKYEG